MTHLRFLGFEGQKWQNYTNDGQVLLLEIQMY